MSEPTNIESQEPPVKRKRGRPKGSKNKHPRKKKSPVVETVEQPTEVPANDIVPKEPMIQSQDDIEVED